MRLYLILNTDISYLSFQASSFAREEKYRSKHNRAYWDGSQYIGCGPGAHVSF